MCAQILVDVVHRQFFGGPIIEDTERDYVPANRAYLSFNEVYSIRKINSAMHVQSMKWENTMLVKRNNIHRKLSAIL